MPAQQQESTGKKAFKLEHDRANCISCGACASVTPKFWEMSKEDGKSDIIGGKERPDGWQELKIKEEDFQGNKEAADVCPVNVIHLTDDDGNKIV